LKNLSNFVYFHQIVIYFLSPTPWLPFLDKVIVSYILAFPGILQWRPKQILQLQKQRSQLLRMACGWETAAASILEGRRLFDFWSKLAKKYYRSYSIIILKLVYYFMDSFKGISASQQQCFRHLCLQKLLTIWLLWMILCLLVISMNDHCGLCLFFISMKQCILVYF